jgi:hypothetical protein
MYTKKMTVQQVYNKVRNHLLKQKTRSIGDGGICAYRGFDGTKCAAGCLIKDKHYRPEFEGITATSTVVWMALWKSGVPERACDVVSRLQLLHDRCLPRRWKAALRELAKEEGLKP